MASPQPLPVLLSQALVAFTVEFDNEFEHRMPHRATTRRTGHRPRGPDISVLLARVLQAFTLDFEAESRISLPISANTLRVLDDTGVRVRDLPVLTGASREGNAMADILHRILGELAGGEADADAPLRRSMTPYPDGWRAALRRPRILPRYPMVLHRGGYPDGR